MPLWHRLHSGFIRPQKAGPGNENTNRLGRASRMRSVYKRARSNRISTFQVNGRTTTTIDRVISNFKNPIWKRRVETRYSSYIENAYDFHTHTHTHMVRVENIILSESLLRMYIKSFFYIFYLDIKNNQEKLPEWYGILRKKRFETREKRISILRCNRLHLRRIRLSVIVVFKRIYGVVYDRTVVLVRLG